MKKSNTISRRNFLGTCGKMSSLPVVSSLLQLKLTNSLLAQTAQFRDYKALVCVFLRGGNDSFNMLTPYESDEYNRYSVARGDKALSRNSLHQIYDYNERKNFGVHASMPEVAEMFRYSGPGTGDIGFVANVGTLVRPTSLNDFRNRNSLPRGLFSHFEQQASWQTSVPEAGAVHGWIGRMSEVINDAAANNSAVSMNISMSGMNRLQTGLRSAPYVVAGDFRDYNNRYSPVAKEGIDATLQHQYSNALENHVNYTRQQIIDQSAAYNDAVSGVSINTDFPNTELGNQLKQVAIAISQRDVLGQKRQTFFVTMNGFDTHGGLIASHESTLPQVSQALDAFNSAMKELGVHNNVLTYTASDFGRSMSGNGTGTDHGWGGNQILMGGAVAGSRVYGEYPEDLSLNSNTDIGRGRQLPTTSVDRFHGEIANWYGVENNSDMETVLPNIRRFWNRNEGRSLLRLR